MLKSRNKKFSAVYGLPEDFETLSESITIE